MTPEEIELAAIQRWQEIFGLEEYEIDLVKKADMGEAAGFTHTEAEYVRAQISLKVGEGDLDQVVSHEVAHVFLAEIAQWANTVLGYTGHQREPLHDAWDLVWERTAERLARLVQRLLNGQ